MGLHGWRSAYAGVGFASLAGAIIVWAMLPRDTRGHAPEAATQSGMAPQLVGLSFSEAFRTRNFWLLSAISVLCIFGVGGVTAHLAPFVRDNGFSASQAAGFASLLATASIAGRVLTGILLDRFRVPATGSVLISLGVAGVVLMAVEGIALAPVAVVLVGFALGAEVDLIAYFASRYFGLRNHGAIFGWNYAMVALGSAVAPVAVGHLRDSTGGYTSAFWLLSAVLVVAAILCLMLGPYTYQAHADQGDSGAS